MKTCELHMGYIGRLEYKGTNKRWRLNSPKSVGPAYNQLLGLTEGNYDRQFPNPLNSLSFPLKLISSTLLLLP